MNIEKVKESLEHLRYLMQQPDDFMFTAKYLREHFSETIAELEKPAEDFTASEAASDIFSNADIWFIGYSKIKQSIQKCAESYHTKKCAECTQKKAAYKLFGAD